MDCQNVDYLSATLVYLAGYNVNHRKRKSGTVGFQHRLTKEDAMKWFQQKYDGIILNTKK